MLKFGLFAAVLVNVFLIVLATETCEDSGDLSSSKETDSYEDRSETTSSSSSYSYEYRSDTTPSTCSSPTCPEHEVYTNCSNSVCPIKNCSQYGLILFCPKINESLCIGGCVCETNYLRNSDGVCIPKDQCPTSCNGDPNAVVSNCANNCFNQCSNLGKKNVVCPLDCEINGCQCKKGFAYDNNIGKCVLPEQCTQTCRENEVYSNCSNGLCRFQYCSQYGNPIPYCPKFNKSNCKGGCICREKYLRNPKGICVPQEKCPEYLCSKANHEVYSNCTNGGCQARNCSQVGLPVPCVKINPANCKKGCVCEDGYLRTNDGKCVPSKQCHNEVYSNCINGGCGVKTCAQLGYPVPCVDYDSDSCRKGCASPTCQENEVFSNCTNGGCSAKNCSQLGRPVPCVRLDPASCKKGCVCQEGYLRADNGTCIPSDQCPSCDGDPNAQPGCSFNCGRHCSNYKEKPSTCPLRPCRLNVDCECRPNYVYDDNLKKCVLPKDCTPTCKENEEFSNCTNGGCDARNCTQLGFPVPCIKLDPASCKKGCVCQQGYLRADNGTCIPSSQCPSCGGDPNAQPGCGVNCGRHCSNYKNKNTICPFLCLINSCDCRPGYVYDDNLSKCVLPKDCTPTCNENEVFSNCTNGGCDPRNCSQLGFPVPCVRLDPASCKKGCVCQPGYLRAENGTCIPSDQCPSCGGDPNAQPGCGINCGRHCSNYKNKHPICPRIACIRNRCDCKKNYVYDDNLKKCVLPQDCTPTCNENEEFSNCTNGGCDPRNCSQLGFPVRCVKLDPASCKKGCICQPGYLRADNGTCIPSDQCPSCGGDPNALPGCGTNCGRHCSNYKNKHPKCPRIACIRNRCDCKKNYVYDDNLKKCVLPQDCTPTCNENEVFSNCTNGGCNPRNCSQLGFPVPCVKLDPACCKKGCICQPGYLRANNGTCIPSNQCPSCGGDPNAQPGCGINCGRHCSNYKTKHPICPRIACISNRCDCKKNYVYDDNLKKCVLPCDCTPTCKLYEVYSNCTNGGCEARNCSQLGSPIRCAKLNPDCCRKGCVCQKGYLRTDNGTCIPEDQCPQQPINNTNDALQRLLDGNTAFTGNFLSVVVNRNIGKSVVMSPFSVLIPCGILAYKTNEGESFNQLMNILNLRTKQEIRSAFPELIQSYQSQTEALLELASKVYVSVKENMTENFERDIALVFKSESGSIDFSNPNQAADIINKWVEEKTKNLIKNLVSPSMFNVYTRLVLTNAIYFLGAWVKQFDPKQTTKRDFYITESKSIQRDFMYRKGSLRYAEIASLDAKVLEIPYKGGNFTYVAFLPNTIGGYVDLVEKLRDPKALNGALDQLNSDTVIVNIPRYKTTTSIDLSDVLKQLNVTDIFNADKSNLDDILESKEKLAVSAAVHKAAITVDEIGTEAAAANALVVGATAVLQTKTFIADHSFIYYILLNRSPLFCGIVSDE